MTSLHLGSWRKQDYGVYTSGYVDRKDGLRVPIQIRSPHEDLDDKNLATVINFNGIIVGIESMSEAAKAAADLGFVAVSLDYSNVSSKPGAIKHNAHDGLAVMDALNERFGKEAFRFLGLSMGGSVAAVAAVEAALSGHSIKELYLVAPGGLTDQVIDVEPSVLLNHFGKELRHEATAASHHPGLAARIALSSLSNCTRRANAVRVEAEEMTHETFYPYLAELRRKSPETIVTLAYGNNDSLVPKEELLESMNAHEVEEEISLRDIDVPYHGTHSELIYSTLLARYILLASDEAVSKMLKHPR